MGEKEARDFTYASPELSGTGSMLISTRRTHALSPAYEKCAHASNSKARAPCTEGIYSLLCNALPAGCLRMQALTDLLRVRWYCQYGARGSGTALLRVRCYC